MLIYLFLRSFSLVCFFFVIPFIIWFLLLLKNTNLYGLCRVFFCFVFVFFGYCQIDLVCNLNKLLKNNANFITIHILVCAYRFYKYLCRKTNFLGKHFRVIINFSFGTAKYLQVIFLLCMCRNNLPES